MDIEQGERLYRNWVIQKKPAYSKLLEPSESSDLQSCDFKVGDTVIISCKKPHSHDEYLELVSEIMRAALTDKQKIDVAFYMHRDFCKHNEMLFNKNVVWKLKK